MTAAAGLAAAAAVSAFSPPRLMLVCDGVLRAQFPLADGDEFAISFIHSVNASEVKESYRRDGGDIVLVSCLYYAFGAGVATEIEEGWSLSYTDDGAMLISGIDRPIPELSYVVGTVSDHILHINGEEHSLRELCGRNSSVLFALR